MYNGKQHAYMLYVLRIAYMHSCIQYRQVADNIGIVAYHCTCIYTYMYNGMQLCMYIYMYNGMQLCTYVHKYGQNMYIIIPTCTYVQNKYIYIHVQWHETMNVCYM